MSTAVATPEEREMEKLRARAFDLERKIIKNIGRASSVWWELARQMYEFHESGAWALLGSDTLEEWLAQPEVTVSRTEFFRFVRLWRDLVVVAEIPKERVKELMPSKVQEVAPAIKAGSVTVDDALDDVEALGARDLRKKYGKAKDPEPEPEPEPEEDEAATGEVVGPEYVDCVVCGMTVNSEQVSNPYLEPLELAFEVLESLVGDGALSAKKAKAAHKAVKEVLDVR